MKNYDLEPRTEKFAQELRNFAWQVYKHPVLWDDIRQVIRSSGSVAGNIIEANESFSSKDFLHRIKICRKEAKESALWLRLIRLPSEKEHLLSIQEKLEDEATQLMKIFGSIITKMERK